VSGGRGYGSDVDARVPADRGRDDHGGGCRGDEPADVLAEQQGRPPQRERRLGDLQTAHPRDPAKRHGVVPGEEAEHHGDHADIAQPGGGAKGHVRGRIGDQGRCGHWNGHREREDDGPADHPPATVPAGHRAAFRVSEAGDRDRDEQQQVGRS
jgi:hypothetical protein